jgi:4-hydroxy-tetrahydrodipicolinate reductase
VLPIGSVAAQRTTIVGKCGGDDVIRFSVNWYCTTDIDPAWDLRPTGWRVRVRGDAPFDVELAFPVALADLGAYTPAYTANRPVNAIPYVCAAPPGILVTADLAPITPAGPPVR